MTRLKANPIVSGKFWIIEEDGERVGTLTKNNDKTFMYCRDTGTSFFENERQLKNTFNDINWGTSISDKDSQKKKEVHTYPTSVNPFNQMYDVKRKLPLFTKSKKSKSLYCAGYYIIRFDKGWVRSFCPKLVTIENYESKGPFRTEIVMRQELSRANANK